MRLNKTCILSGITLFLFLSCRNNQTKLTEVLQARVDSLLLVNDSLAEQQKEISDFLEIITESLDSIAEQENYIRAVSKGIEGKKMSRSEIKQSLSEFAQLLERQRNRIAQLEDSLANRGESFEKLGNIINYLNHQIDEKNRNISALQKELNQGKVQIKKLNETVEQLSLANDSLVNTIQQQEQALVVQSEVINEGYFLVGTQKELKEAGVITGGIIKKKLNISNLGNVGFTKVDISQFTRLEINSKKIKILTQMPQSSYTITSTGGQCILEIIDPPSFWSVSNYLVIQTK